MTPAQRAAKIKAAEALLKEVEGDEDPAPAAPAAAPAAVTKPTLLKRVFGNTADVVATPVAPAAESTTLQETRLPGDTRPSTQPPLWKTLSDVAKIMKGKK
jgi:hypothetical protein